MKVVCICEPWLIESFLPSAWLKSRCWMMRNRALTVIAPLVGYNGNTSSISDATSNSSGCLAVLHSVKILLLQIPVPVSSAWNRCRGVLNKLWSWPCSVSSAWHQILQPSSVLHLLHAEICVYWDFFQRLLSFAVCKWQLAAVKRSKFARRLLLWDWTVTA